MPSFALVFPSTDPATATGGAPRSQYRPALAREIGLSALGYVRGQMTGLEAERYVYSAQFLSDTTQPAAFDGLYLYVTSGAAAGQQRRLVMGSYDGSSGLLEVDYPFSVALSEGDAFEISELPAEDYLGVTGLNRALNRGLDTMPVIHLLDRVAEGGRVRYDLADCPWPVLGVGDVYAPRADEQSPRFVVGGARWELNAEQSAIVLPYAFTDGDTFVVQVHRPASTWIRQSGWWGDAVDGMTQDTDEALYSVAAVVRAALPFALEQLGFRYGRGSPERSQLLGEAKDARVRANFSRFYGSFRLGGVQRVGAVQR